MFMVPPEPSDEHHKIDSQYSDHLVGKLDRKLTENTAYKKRNIFFKQIVDKCITPTVTGISLIEQEVYRNGNG